MTEFSFPIMPGENWTREEVEATVADYFAMLDKETAGISYSKADHRRNLRQLLKERSDKSVEYKHMNISAVLYTLGFPRIVSGYSPMYNFQGLLRDVVAERLSGSQQLVLRIEAEEKSPIAVPRVEDILNILASPPKPGPSGSKVRESTPSYVVRQVNYLERESRNQKLGLAGEELVLRYERERLSRAGHDRLADKVDHVAISRGDGMGYDILSYETTGQERLIEVKTTKYGKDAPFFVSRNEVNVSRSEARRYYLYRLYEFVESPKLFALNGALPSICSLEPDSYIATVA